MEKVIYEKKCRIAYIALNRPDKLNAMDDEMNRDLREIWADFETDTSVDVAILSGRGKAFCAGADINTYLPKWKKATLQDVRNNVAAGVGGGITRGQHRITKPVIAAIHGYAVGGGFELALACDIRIAADTAVFGVFEVRRGLHQGDGGLVRLLACAGAAVALDLTLTGREVKADEALRLGLVQKVVSDDRLLETAEEYAGMILQNDQGAIRSAKTTLMDIIGMPLDRALEIEALRGYSCLLGSGQSTGGNKP